MCFDIQYLYLCRHPVSPYPTRQRCATAERTKRMCWFSSAKYTRNYPLNVKCSACRTRDEAKQKQEAKEPGQEATKPELEVIKSDSEVMKR